MVIVEDRGSPFSSSLMTTGGASGCTWPASGMTMSAGNGMAGRQAVLARRSMMLARFEGQTGMVVAPVKRKEQLAFPVTRGDVLTVS